MCGFCHFAKLSFLQLIIFHCVYSCFVPSTFFPGDGAFFFFFFALAVLCCKWNSFRSQLSFFFFGKDSPWFWDNFIELFSQIVYSGWWFPKWGMRHEILHKADNQSHWLLFNTKVCQEWDYYYGNSFCIQGALWVLLFIYNYKPG